jgi:hypothetical protein
MWILWLACETAEEPPLDPASSPAAPEVPQDCGGCPVGVCVEGVCVHDEEDDTWEQARVLLVGAPITQVIWPDEDRDWYRLEIEGPSWVEVSSFTGSDPDFDAVFTVYGGEGSLLWTRLEEPMNAPVFLAGAGSWWIEVADRGGGGDEDFSYTLIVQPADGLIAGQLEEPLVVTEAVAVGLPAQTVLPMEVGDALSTLSAEPLTATGASLEVDGQWVADGALEWPLADLGGMLLSGGAWGGAVVLSALPEVLPLEQEPNDTPEQAQALPGARGHLSDGDADWFDPGVTGPLRVECPPPGGLQESPILTFVSSQGQELATAQGALEASMPAGGQVRLTGNTAPGTWYACVFHVEQ